MLHLTSERLAALADEEPTPLEAAHLNACPACVREREAYDALRSLSAAERMRLGPPLVAWEALAGRLRDDGIVAPDAPAAGALPARRSKALRVPAWWMQVAAGLLLATGGLAAGRLSAGASLLPGDAGPRERMTITYTPTPTPTPPAAASEGLPSFRSREQAMSAMLQAERLYQHASAFLVDQTDRDAATTLRDSSGVYMTRLAAFDGVVAATREALHEAPYDPVINRYYLATLGARDATLRQLNTALPVGTQVSSY